MMAKNKTCERIFMPFFCSFRIFTELHSNVAKRPTEVTYEFVPRSQCGKVVKNAITLKNFPSNHISKIHEI